jgi:hypothetical protein
MAVDDADGPNAVDIPDVRQEPWLCTPLMRTPRTL